jgi:Mce-associated membrane protein
MSRLAARLVALVGVLAALGVIALAGVGGAVYWNRVETSAESQTREVLPKLAAEQLPRIFGYDYQTVERSLGDVYPLLTDDFRQRFSEQVTKTVIPEARKRQLIVQVNVVGAGMLAAQRSSGSVMVFMNLTYTDQSKQPVYEGSRVRVDYEKVGSDWKMQAINPI